MNKHVKLIINMCIFMLIYSPSCNVKEKTHENIKDTLVCKNKPVYYIDICQYDYIFRVTNGFFNLGTLIIHMDHSDNSIGLVFYYQNKKNYTYESNFMGENIKVNVKKLKTIDNISYYLFKFNNIACYEGDPLDVIYITNKEKGIIGSYYALPNDSLSITTPTGNIPDGILELANYKVYSKLK